MRYINYLLMKKEKDIRVNRKIHHHHLVGKVLEL